MVDKNIYKSINLSRAAIMDVSPMGYFIGMQGIHKTILKMINVTLISWIYMNGLKIYKYFQKYEYVQRTCKVYNFTI